MYNDLFYEEPRSSQPDQEPQEPKDPQRTLSPLKIEEPAPEIDPGEARRLRRYLRTKK